MFELNDAQARKLSGTRASDGEGRPLVLHHGTRHRFDRFERTDDLGFHFGSIGQARRRLVASAKERKDERGDERIVSVALAIANPLVFPHDPKFWNPSQVGQWLERFLTRPELAQAKKHHDGGDREHRLLLKGIILSALERAGHDAIIYRNRYENVRGRAVDWSWLALKPGSILVLGEDLDVTAAGWPTGFDNAPGTDPDETVRLHGGLRTHVWELARPSDMRRFHEAGVSAIHDRFSPARRFPDAGWKHASQSHHKIGDAYLTISLNGERGQARVEVAPLHRPAVELAFRRGETPAVDLGHVPAFEAMLSDLQASQDLIATSVTLGRAPSSLTVPIGVASESWHPGEPLDLAMGRFRSTLAGIVDRLKQERDMAPSGPRPA